MNRLCLSIVFFLLFFGITGFSFAFDRTDSIGVEVMDGKTIILHKVDPGETLFTISKRYSVPVSTITQANPGSDMGIRVGQVLKVPKETATAPTTTSGNSEFHLVMPGETLYSISQKYPCSVEDIQKWNHLTSNELSPGQQLRIVAPQNTTVRPVTITINNPSENTEVTTEKETVTDVEMTETTPTEEEVETTSATTTTEDTVVKQSPTVYNTTKTVSTLEEEDQYKGLSVAEKIRAQAQTVTYEKEVVNEDSLPIKYTQDMGGYSKTFEKGFAVLMEGTSSDERYLAHHRDLPIGTILQVKNLDNGKTVFVRIVGTLEEEDPKIVISISMKAQIRLHTGDKSKALTTAETTFPTEISYIP